MNVDPYCDSCFDICGAVLDDVDHAFSKCVKTKEVWREIRSILISLEPSLACRSDIELLTLDFPKSDMDMELVWLLGTFIVEAWKIILLKDATCLDRGVVFGYLKFKYREDQLGARPAFKEIRQLI